MPQTGMRFAYDFEMTEPDGHPTAPYEARLTDPALHDFVLAQIVGWMNADATAKGRPVGQQMTLKAKLRPGSVEHFTIP